ncbi:MAG: DUF523 and DUF1722 domain-containing protein [Candidatus Palauibacterales bacterium]|nr:DUF523 and DUF1722 domain-containing protein [Candidatus Palauibacterales bacterium]
MSARNRVRNEAPSSAPRPVRIGVSSCLLGQKVRYDGGHKRDRFATDVLEPFVEWVPLCPEVEIGLGIPRPTIRLERDENGEARLVMPSTGEDLTGRMAQWAEEKVDRLLELDLCGYILKKDSPSCGMERVKVYDRNGVPARSGTGTFAEVLLRKAPYLAVEEEGRLNDARLRENFISRVFAARRWLDMQAEGFTRARLMDYHARHKFLCMARNQAGTRRLGRLLGSATGRDSDPLLARAYLEEFTAVMRRPPSPKGHANVLQHLAGYVSSSLDAADRGELADSIHAYRRGLLPLVVPLTLIRHHARRQERTYLLEQAYLSPHPHELMLLNHV